MLTYHGGLSFVEAWNLPIKWRQWLIQRINAELQKQSGGEENQDASDATIARLLNKSQPHKKKF